MHTMGDHEPPESVDRPDGRRFELVRDEKGAVVRYSTHGVTGEHGKKFKRPFLDGCDYVQYKCTWCEQASTIQAPTDLQSWEDMVCGKKHNGGKCNRKLRRDGKAPDVSTKEEQAVRQRANLLSAQARAPVPLPAGGAQLRERYGIDPEPSRKAARTGPTRKNPPMTNDLICWGHSWQCDVHHRSGLRWFGRAGKSEAEALTVRDNALIDLDAIDEGVRMGTVCEEVLKFCEPDLADVMTERKIRGECKLQVTVGDVSIAYLKDERSALIAYAILSHAYERMRKVTEKRTKNLAALRRKLKMQLKQPGLKRQMDETMCSVCLDECNELQPWGYMIHCCGKPFHVSCMTEVCSKLGVRCPACRTEKHISIGRLLEANRQTM